jgi:hypothetical protein
MDDNFKRVNVLITAAQHARVSKSGLNLSGLVRDLLDDHFSGSRITVSLSSRVRSLYDQVVSNFGASDKDLEPYLADALDRFLADKGREIQRMRGRLKQRRQAAR